MTTVKSSAAFTIIDTLVWFQCIDHTSCIVELSIHIIMVEWKTSWFHSAPCCRATHPPNTQIYYFYRVVWMKVGLNMSLMWCVVEFGRMKGYPIWLNIITLNSFKEHIQYVSASEQQPTDTDHWYSLCYHGYSAISAACKVNDTLGWFQRIDHIALLKVYRHYSGKVKNLMILLTLLCCALWLKL